MTEAVIWLVLWVVLATAGTALIYAAMAFIGSLTFMALDKPLLAGMAVVIAWISAVVWFAFAAVQVALQIISVVQLSTAGA